MSTGIVFGAAGLLGPVWVETLAKKCDKVFAVGLGIASDENLAILKQQYKSKIELVEHDLLTKINLNLTDELKYGVISAGADSTPSNTINYEIGKFPWDTWQTYLNNIQIVVNCLDYFCENKSTISRGVIIGSMYINKLPSDKNYVDFDGIQVFRKHPGYSSSKIAIKNIMKIYAKKFAAEGLNINMLSPGVVENSQPNWFKKNILEDIPNKNFLQKTELTTALSYLLNDDEKHLVGHELIIDGGFTL